MAAAVGEPVAPQQTIRPADQLPALAAWQRGVLPGAFFGVRRAGAERLGRLNDVDVRTARGVAVVVIRHAVGVGGVEDADFAIHGGSDEHAVGVEGVAVVFGIAVGKIAGDPIAIGPIDHLASGGIGDGGDGDDAGFRSPVDFQKCRDRKSVV